MTDENTQRTKETICDCSCTTSEYSDHALTCPFYLAGKSARLTREPSREAPSSKPRAIWHRANKVEVPDRPDMIDWPGDTVSKFVAVSNGFMVGRARWHYPTKSWCHKEGYQWDIVFWSVLPGEDGSQDETTEKPINTRGRCGLAEPDNDLVICPACTSQFRAIPVNVQRQLATYEELLGERAAALKTGLDKRFPEEPSENPERNSASQGYPQVDPRHEVSDSVAAKVGAAVVGSETIGSEKASCVHGHNPDACVECHE